MALKLMKWLLLQQCHLLLQIAHFLCWLGDHCSIYTAELKAILYALKHHISLKKVNPGWLTTYCKCVSYSLKKLVCWCFEPSQPQRIISRLETNISLSPSYSAQRPQNHKILTFYYSSLLQYSTQRPLPLRAVGRNLEQNIVDKAETDTNKLARVMRAKTKRDGHQLLKMTIEEETTVMTRLPSNHA